MTFRGWARIGASKGTVLAYTLSQVLLSMRVCQFLPGTVATAGKDDPPRALP